MYDRQKKFLWSHLKVGIIVTLGIVIGAIAIFFLGNFEKIFISQGKLFVVIEDVEGLRRGAPVWFRGIEVGTVQDISLDYGESIVTLSISNKIFQYIYNNAFAEILTLGLLGDKYIQLNPGFIITGTLNPGDTIAGEAAISFEDIISVSTSSIQRVDQFIEQLDTLLQSLTANEGTISRLIHDPRLYESMTQTFASLDSFIKEINQSGGSLQKFINDPSLYTNINDAARKIEAFGDLVLDSSSTIRNIIEDKSLYVNLKQTVLQLEQLSQILLYEDTGVIPSLIHDKKLLQSLEQTIESVNLILQDIKSDPRKYFTFELF